MLGFLSLRQREGARIGNGFVGSALLCINRMLRFLEVLILQLQAVGGGFDGLESFRILL